MAGAPPPCTSPGTPPPGTNNIVVTWYRNWPILLDESVSQAYYAQLQQNIANAGGVIYSVKFYDASNNLIPGLDRCGNPIATPPPPPGGGGGSGGAPPGPDDDELTIGFAELMLELQTLINLIQKLTTSQPQPINYSQCCHAIVVALEALVKIVTKLEVTLSQPGAAQPPALDLTGVVTELTCVCTNLTAISTSSATVATDLAPGLKSIADAVNSVDISQIVEQLQKANDLQDVPHAIIQQMIADKVIPTQYSGLLQGTPDTWVKTVLGILGVVVPVVGVIENLTGNEDTFEAGKRAINEGFKTVVSAAIRSVKAASGLKDTDTSTALHDAFAKWVSSNDDILTPIVTPFVNTIVEQLQPRIGHGPISIGDIGVDPDEALATAVGIAMTSTIAAWVLSFMGVDQGESLTHMAEIFGDLVGFEELRDVKIGPLIDEGIGKVARTNAKSLFRQDLPGYSEIWSLVGRGLFDRDRAQHLMARTGVPFEFENATEQAALAGLPPFLMIRLSGTGLFSDADIADELTFRGIRPTSQHRFIAAAAFLRTQPERNKFLATVERVYAAGLISDNNFIAARDSAAHNTDSNNLSLRTVQLEKQIALAHEYEAAYSNEFLHGLLDAPGYQSALEALGMQPPDVAARMFRDETHLSVTQTLGAERAARAALRKTQAEAKKAAIEGFRTGTIDSAALTAALNLAGLTPAQTAAEVEYQVLASSGVLRWIYGRHLSPQDATLLRQQVQDLTRQREIQMLTDAQYVSQLQALSIPQRVIQALRAGANAHISPKTQAILTPPTV